MAVKAYHLILTTYGFWLPNDPRGSWSDVVFATNLQRFGEATKTNTRRSVAGVAHNLAVRRQAKTALSRPAVVLTGKQARAIVRGFGKYITASSIQVYACAIMPDHAHLVVLRHRYNIETIANLLKGAATTALNEENLHPFADRPYRNGKLPSPWARREWPVFLEDDNDIRRSVKYVNNNPTKDGMRPQKYSFVQRYSPSV